MPNSNNTRFYWKGNLVTEKVYNQKQENVENSEQESIDKVLQEKEQHVDHNKIVKPGEGRRIVELLELGDQMWCCNCRKCLSFQNIENELRRGKQHSMPASKKQDSCFDINIKLALGLMHSGIGFENVNKLLTYLNIPPIDLKTYKQYQAEADESTEKIAKQLPQVN